MTTPNHQPLPGNPHETDDPAHTDWSSVSTPEDDFKWDDFEWGDFDSIAIGQSGEQDGTDPYFSTPPDIDQLLTPGPDTVPDITPDQQQSDLGDGIEYFDPDTFVPDQSPERSRHVRASKIARNILRRVGGSQEVVSERALTARRDRAEQDILRPAESMVVDDKEILGRSEFVNLQVHEAQHDITNYKSMAEFRDSLAIPRKNYIDWRRKRIQTKVDRLEREVNASPDTRWNRHRKNKLDMLKKRVDWRKGQLNKHTEARTKRAEVLAGRIDKRNVRLQKEIDHVINKKIEAQRRKVEHAMYKNEKGRIFGSFVIHPIERTNYMNSLTSAQRQEITKQAILNIREKNIKKGNLDVGHTVDPSRESREVNDYELAA